MTSQDGEKKKKYVEEQTQQTNLCVETTNFEESSRMILSELWEVNKRSK